MVGRVELDGLYSSFQHKLFCGKAGQQQGGIWCLREVFVMVWGAARWFLAKVCLLSPRGFGIEARAGEPNEL